MDTQTFPTPEPPRIDLGIGSGTVRIETTDDAETVLEVRGEHSPNDVTVRFDPGNPARLSVAQEKRWGFGRANLSVRVRTPHGARVTAGFGSADVEISGRLGSLTLRSGSGDVEVDEVSGDAKVQVASGDVRIGSVGGRLDLTSASGDAWVDHVSGDMKAHFASGGLRIDRAEASLDVSTTSGDIVVGEVSTGTTAVRAMSGDVRVGVRPGTRVYLDVSSVSGEVASDLDPSEAVSGAPTNLELRATSVSGNVRIVRAGATTRRS